MENRIKKIRELAGLNQADFGMSVGVKQSAITGYETGARKPRDTVIKLICDEYHINKQWLLTGEGEMYMPETKEREVEELVKKILDDPEQRKLRMVKWIVELDDNALRKLEALKILED